MSREVHVRFCEGPGVKALRPTHPRMRCTWRQCVTLFTEELPWLKGADLDLVMGRAFCAWIGW